MVHCRKLPFLLWNVGYLDENKKLFNAFYVIGGSIYKKVAG